MSFNAQGFTQDALKAGATPQQIREFIASKQPQKQKVGGLKGLVANMLPLIGGTVGAVGGSFVAPGAGTAAGGAGGSALGAFAKQKLLGEKTDWGNIATEGAMGAIPGVGKLAKSGYTGAKGLLGAKALAEGGTATKALQGSEAMSAATKAANVPKIGGGAKTIVNPTIGDLQDLTASGQTAKLGRMTTDKFQTPFIQVTKSEPTIAQLEMQSKAGTLAKPSTSPTTNPAQLEMQAATKDLPQAMPPSATPAPAMSKIDKSIQNSQNAKAESLFGKDASTTKDYQTPLKDSRRAELDAYRQSKGITSNQPKEVAKQLEANHQRVTSNLTQALAKGNRPVTQAERDNLANSIEASWANNTNIKSANPKLKQDILDRIRSAKDSKDLESIAKYRINSLDSGAKFNAAGDAAGTANSTINKAARDEVSKFTGNASPEYKAAQQEYSLSNEAISRANTTSGRVVDAKVPIVNVPIRGSGQAVEGLMNKSRDLKIAATKGVNKFWNGSAGAPPPPPVNPAAGAAVVEQAGATATGQGFKPYVKAGMGQAISRAVVNPMLPQSEDQKQAQAIENTLTQYEQENPTAGTDMTGIEDTLPADTGPFGDKQKVQQAYMAALADGNTKAAGMILDGYKMFGSDGTSTKPLSAESSKVISNANSGLTSLAQLRQAIGQDPSAKTKQIIPGQGMFGGAGSNALGTGSYNAAQKNILDVITRLRTGAAMTEGEEKFYRGMMPQAFDDADTTNQKLNTLQDLFESIASRTGNAGNDTQGIVGL